MKNYKICKHVKKVGKRAIKVDEECPEARIAKAVDDKSAYVSKYQCGKCKKREI